MPDETYVPNPAQPEGPQISAPIATEIGNAMMQGAADDVKAKTERREEIKAEQIAKPLQEGAITGIPSEISTTTPDTLPSGVVPTTWDTVPTPSTIQDPEQPPVTTTPSTTIPTTTTTPSTVPPTTTTTTTPPETTITSKPPITNTPPTKIINTH